MKWEQNMKRHNIAIVILAVCLGFSPVATAATTWQVTPLNVEQVQTVAAPGDTQVWTGAFTFNNSLEVPAGVNYVGNNATLTATAALIASNQQTLTFKGATATTSFTGFSILNNFLAFSNGSFNVHDNAFAGSASNAVLVVGVTNSHFDHNTFLNIGAVGIYGYPGNNNTFDNNTFTHCWESIHLVAGCDQTDVSGNVVTKGCRIGIELQNPMTNLTIENNYLADWLPNPETGANPASHMAISCATSGGSNVTISGNTILHNADNGANYSGTGYAIEAAAGKNVTIKNNTSWGWDCFLLNALAGSNTVSNNTIYGGSEWGMDGGGPYPAPTDSDGPIQPLAALSPLPAPPKAADSVALATTQPAQPVIPPGISAVLGSSPGTVVVVAPTGSVLGIYPSSQGASTAVGLGTMNGATVTISGIPQNWQVTVTVATGGQTYTLPSVQVVQSGVPAAGPFNPQLAPSSTPAADPAPSTLEFESVDGGKTITRTN
jgi:hypothetical protein